MKRSTEMFLAGFSIHALYMSLWADFMGREAYAQYVLDHWISANITVPLALVCLVFWLWVIFFQKRPENETPHAL